jgi:thioredoxin reductase
VVRSEERLRAGTELKVSGRAVLRTYIVTETVTQTSQVRHKEFRVDYEAVTDAEATSKAEVAFDDRVVEVVSHREVPVVQMEVIATERVRMHVDTITKQMGVSANLSKEQLELDVQSTPPGP